jgi:hypothetical protein
MSNPSQRAWDLVGYEPSAMVPAGYAEKSMASLMQLHAELMDEKERRVDLYRRLMDKEQSLAELKMYVRLLEDKIGKQNQDGRSAGQSPRTESTKAPYGNGSRTPLKPPQPPRPIGRERARFALKPRPASGQAGPIRSSNGAFHAPPAAESFGARSDSSRAGDRPGADGWRAW